MGTVIRAELSSKNRYWIPKHRYYELKHFCLQYPTWKHIYAILDNSVAYGTIQNGMPRSTNIGDPTGNRAVLKSYYANKINLIEKTAKDTDELIGEYVLKAVTEELSYTYLKTKLDIPCGKDMYYDRYRKFFWLLSQTRN